MMETQISEEDLLSGIELLPTTEPNTPNNFLDQSSKSSLSILSDSLSPEKSFHLISPSKYLHSQTTDDSASQLQKILQNSLAYSLRKEAQLKCKWPASPGEVLMVRKQNAHFANQSSTSTTQQLQNFGGGVSSMAAYTSVMNRNHLLTIPTNSSDHHSKTASGEAIKNDLPISIPTTTSHKGPNVCLAKQFPSGISPIKHCPENSPKKPVPTKSLFDNIDQHGDDPNTKKLLAFVNNLERGDGSTKSIADQLAHLSLLLRNSSNTSINPDDKNDTVKDDFEIETKPENIILKKYDDNKGLDGSKKANSKPISSLHRAAKQPIKSKGMKKTSDKHGSANINKQNAGIDAKQKADIALQHYKTTRTTSTRSGNSKAVQGVRNDNGSRRPEKLSSKSTFNHTSNQKNIAEEKQGVLHDGENILTVQQSKPFQDMDNVRNHLQSMLTASKIDPLSLDISGGEIHNSTQDSKGEVDTFRSNDTATLLRAQPSDVPPVSPLKDISGSLTESLTSGLFGLLKAGLKQPSSARSSVDTSLTAENGILRDTLEKETYRRKHCEKQIQKLQKRVLEIQQELAVAHSTDRKKDVMIAQLDKTLAKVVDGWKGHEANLTKSIEQLTCEKETNKQEIVKLKEMLVSLENELAKTLEELVDEKERLLQTEEKAKQMQTNYQARTEEISHVIDQKNESLNNLHSKNDKLNQEKNFLKQTIDDIKSESEDQKKMFVAKEEEWEEAVIEMEKQHKEALEKEKSHTEQERNHAAEIQSSLLSTQQEVVRLERLVESQQTDLEAISTRAEVLETKHSADLRKMETDHKIAVERQIMEKLGKVHEEAQNSESRIRENHKKQIFELMDSHKKELETQCRRYEDEMQRRDESMRRTLFEKEKSLNEKLTAKAESMRQQMLSKMQNLLQTHYSETLQVVGNTTTSVTPQRASLLSEAVRLPNESFLGASTRSTIQPHAMRDHRAEISQDMRNFSDMRLSQTVGPSISLQSLSAQAPYRSTVVKPVPTVPSAMIYPSAFTVSSALPPPSVTQYSSSHLRSVAAMSDQSSTTSHSFLPAQPSEQLPVDTYVEEADIEEEALPNLSLISSISHSTVASLQQKGQQFTVPATNMLHINTADAILHARKQYEKSISMPIDEVALANRQENNEESKLQMINNSQNEQEVRKSQLQHYVQRLLQRSPGDPLDASAAESSPGSGNTHTDDDNKENESMKMAVPVVSLPNSGATALLQILNQQMKASPDLVPVKQKPALDSSFKPPTSMTVSIQPKTTSFNKKNSDVVRRDKPSVRFAQEPMKPKAVTSVQNTSLNANSGASFTGFLNPAQMSEISQMLGLYSTSSTPTGETKLAAEQLLNYLRDYKTPVDSKTSVQPSVTSSPVAAKNAAEVKQSNKVPDMQRIQPQYNGKTKSKSSLQTPTKSVPVWR